MAKTKTTQTNNSVTEFLDKVENQVRREDGYKLLDFFKTVTGDEPKMWGPSIIGFGSYHYKYASGHEGDAPLAGFSPRKDSLVVYMANEFNSREELLSQLGKHKSSKACLYIKKLSDVDIQILEKIILNSTDYVRELYP